mgnify:CR=1 FL=1
MPDDPRSATLDEYERAEITVVSQENPFLLTSNTKQLTILTSFAFRHG